MDASQRFLRDFVNTSCHTSRRIDGGAQRIEGRGGGEQTGRANGRAGEEGIRQAGRAQASATNFFNFNHSFIRKLGAQIEIHRRKPVAAKSGGTSAPSSPEPSRRLPSASQILPGTV
jgi:hypothetical protein